MGVVERRRVVGERRRVVGEGRRAGCRGIAGDRVAGCRAPVGCKIAGRSMLAAAADLAVMVECSIQQQHISPASPARRRTCGLWRSEGGGVQLASLKLCYCHCSCWG